jgi:hypothetical protein
MGVVFCLQPVVSDRAHTGFKWCAHVEDVAFGRASGTLSLLLRDGRHDFFFSIFSKSCRLIYVDVVD